MSAIPSRSQTYIYNEAGLPTGDQPSAVASADLNGDGRLDLVVANQVANSVSVILSKSDGKVAKHARLMGLPSRRTIAGGKSTVACRWTRRGG